MIDPRIKAYAGGLISYDGERRRVWVGSQRLHHGLTGAMLAAHRITRRGGFEWALLGTALMAHDWHDRTAWFERGPQE